MRCATVFVCLLVLTTVGAASSSLSDVLPSGGVPGAQFERAIQDSFAAPGPPHVSAMGLDWVPGMGIMYFGTEVDGYLYEVEPNGMPHLLVDMASQLGFDAEINGVCYVGHPEGGLIYTTDYNGHDLTQDPIFVFDEVGALVDSINVRDFCPGVAGIAFDGAFFYLSSYDNDTIIRCTEAFEPVDTWPHPGAGAGAGSHGGGIDFDPMTGHIYLMDAYNTFIYVCDMGMNVVDAFPSHWYGSVAFGVSIGRLRSERTLWITSWATNRIYEIDDPFFTPVQDGSWGGIKAMFR
ncbi:MAG: hypothetical protein GF405_07450 [Candidatus Eisenbacteria bacterium]|nr:hypothetical protein [Candidatus Eisenbacteria bacterium]